MDKRAHFYGFSRGENRGTNLPRAQSQSQRRSLHDDGNMRYWVHCVGLLPLQLLFRPIFCGRNHDPTFFFVSAVALLDSLTMLKKSGSCALRNRTTITDEGA